MSRAVLLTALLNAGGYAQSPRAPAPPVAERRSYARTIHSERLSDDYWWMRNARDSALQAYVTAENRYAAYMLQTLDTIRSALYGLLRSEFSMPDTSPSYRLDDYRYYVRGGEERDYPLYVRRKLRIGSSEEVLLDLSAFARTAASLSIGDVVPSDDGALLAVTLSVEGGENFDLFVKEARSERRVGCRAAQVTTAAWAADGHTIFFVVADSMTRRPFRLMRCDAASGVSTTVYLERDPSCSISVERSRSRAFLFLQVSCDDMDEIRYLPAKHSSQVFRVLLPRRHDQWYSADHRGQRFYLRINDTGSHFRLVSAPMADPRRDNWYELVEHRTDVLLESVAAFRDYLVRFERQGNRRNVVVTSFRSGKARAVLFPDSLYGVSLASPKDWSAPTLRLRYATFATPPRILEIDPETGRFIAMGAPAKESGYHTQRLFATAPDGAKIPISVVIGRGQERAAGAPMLLSAYGAYGYTLDPDGDVSLRALLERGVNYAVAHVRGGGELGPGWHAAGRGALKSTSVSDFLACVRYLIDHGYTTPEHLVARGASAGALVVAAAVNQAPDQFKGVLLESPFLDLIATMADTAAPFTSLEYGEWGDPRDLGVYRAMRMIDPYANIRRQRYPATLVVSSLNDQRVSFTEAARYVARRRAITGDASQLLLVVDSDGGHSRPVARTARLKRLADLYSFILWNVGETRQGR